MIIFKIIYIRTLILRTNYYYCYYCVFIFLDLLYELTDMKPEEQRLVYSGKVLNDEDLLSFYSNYLLFYLFNFIIHYFIYYIMNNINYIYLNFNIII